MRPEASRRAALRVRRWLGPDELDPLLVPEAASLTAREREDRVLDALLAQTPRRRSFASEGARSLAEATAGVAGRTATRARLAQRAVTPTLMLVAVPLVTVLLMGEQSGPLVRQLLVASILLLIVAGNGLQFLADALRQRSRVARARVALAWAAEREEGLGEGLPMLSPFRARARLALTLTIVPASLAAILVIGVFGIVADYEGFGDPRLLGLWVSLAIMLALTAIAAPIAVRTGRTQKIARTHLFTLDQERSEHSTGLDGPTVERFASTMSTIGR